MSLAWAAWRNETVHRLVECCRDGNSHLNLDSNDFMHCVSEFCSETDFQTVVDALRSSRLIWLAMHLSSSSGEDGVICTYGNGRSRSARQMVTRIHALVEALGSIPTIKDVQFSNRGPRFAKLFYHLLGRLKQIETLYLMDNFEDPESVTQLSESLSHHPALHTLRISLLSNECNLDSIVRTIQSMPRLNFVELRNLIANVYAPNTLNRSQVQAIRELLTVRGSSQNLEVSIYKCNFSQPELLEVLCDGIRHASVQRLVFPMCSFVNSEQFAQAMALSSIKQYTISNCADYTRKQASQLFTAFGEHLSESSMLEELSLYFHVDASDLPNVAAQAAAIRGAGRCPRLRHLHITLDTLESVAFLDEALASCLETINTTGLEHIQVTYYRTEGGGAALVETAGQRLQLPLFFQALVTNVSLKFFTFRENRTVFAWKDQQNLEMILRLNREGRSYMVTEPNNVVKAVAVLEGVLDDLDCLFYHLRENPVIFRTTALAPSGREGTNGTLQHGRSKRKRRPDNDGKRFSERRTRYKDA